jgi:hypothetical protein
MPRLSYSLLLLPLFLLSCGGGGKDGPTEPPVVPTLQGTPLTLSLTEAHPTGSFFLTTIPEGKSLGWQLKTKPDWLTVTPDRGTVRGTTVVVVTAAPPPTHEPGLMSGSVELTTASGAVLNLTVEVDLPPTPHLVYSATSIAIPASSDTGTITITNAGRGGVSWRAGSAVSWLTVLPPSGFLGTRASTVAQVVVNRAALPAGTTTGSINILSGVEAVATDFPVTVASPP